MNIEMIVIFAFIAAIVCVVLRVRYEKKAEKKERYFPKTKPIEKVPQTKDIQDVNHYYLSYDGKQGYAQVVGRIEKKFVAILVNNGKGKVNRIMKVTNRKFFVDFGGTCTELNIKATGFILPG